MCLLLGLASSCLASAPVDGILVGGQGDDGPVPGRSNIIRVSGNRNYPPYEFVDKNGQPAGFTVDLVRAVAEVMGMDVRIQLNEWSKVRSDLAAGRIDMSLGMSHTPEREAFFDYPSPHSIVQHAIFARKGTPPVGSLEELRGHKVIVFRDGAMHDRLKLLGFGDDLVPADTVADALRLLASGRCDYTVTALLPSMYIIRENKLSNLVPVNKNIASYKFSFAVRKGNHALQSRLNEGLAILIKTGQYQQIYDKWLGVLEPKKVSWDKALQYGAMTLFPLVLLLAGTFVWSRSLQNRVNQRTRELALEVSEKERALEELRLHQDKLVQADKLASLGILVSGVAHEINNPNGLILMSMPILKESQDAVSKVLEDYCREHGDFMCGQLPYSRMRNRIPALLHEVHEGAKRIKRIVDDLKDFARQSDAASMEPFDMNDVVQAATRLIESSIRKATRGFTASYADDLPKVMGNAQRIEQVVVNLILNACQALPDQERRIFVSTSFERKQGKVVLKVRDEGIGIDSEQLLHLTDPFYTTKRETGGTGLGLSVSAGIVKEHGGLLEFASEPGTGTTVTLSLPTA
ncbi:transporter substrate-binding domain-containing protein [Geomonas sp. Red51]|nr:transporter substrate-binding domain-containing protein [Geomonas azotofigens]